MSNDKSNDKYDDNVPVPRAAVGRPRKWDWTGMAVGQSLYVPGERLGKVALLNAQLWAKANPVTQIRCMDGFAMPSGLTLAEVAEVEREHGAAMITVIARRRFTGRRTDLGWRIWRTEDVPIAQGDTFPSGAAGVRWVKDDI